MHINAFAEDILSKSVQPVDYGVRIRGGQSYRINKCPFPSLHLRFIVTNKYIIITERYMIDLIISLGIGCREIGGAPMIIFIIEVKDHVREWIAY